MIAIILTSSSSSMLPFGIKLKLWWPPTRAYL